MDWKRLIADLRAKGLSQTKIGDQIGLSQASIVDVLQGRTKDLRWAVGQSLIQLHKQMVRKPAERRGAADRRANRGN